MSQDEEYMLRAVELARLGAGQVSPNPMVGCVVVHNGRIIGEGWHQKFGESHAEVNAIQSVGDKALLQKSTVYVNLEPCSHHGKTPPCADLLIRERVKSVVIANPDTNPLAGGGIRKLREAGIEVVTGVLEKEGRELNKRFFRFVESKRPYIILKWAETSDGFLARTSGESKWISSVQSRQLVHRWRSEEDAVLVGTRTAMIDDPSLNVRNWSGRNPVRVVIDRNRKLDGKLKLFDGTQSTLVYTLEENEKKKNIEWVRLAGKSFTRELVDDLYHRNVQSLIVEGGASTLQHFINEGLWDEAKIFRASSAFGSGISAPVVKGEESEVLLEGDRLVTVRNS